MDRRARWIERGWEGGDRRVSKLANRPTAYPLYPPGITKPTCDPMYHQREREIEGKRERESADPFLPLAFDQQVPPPFPPPYLSNTQHRETSSNFVFAAILPFDMCSLGVKGGGCPRFVFHFPHLARLINFTRTRVLIMTCAHTRSTRHDQLESLNEFLPPRINRTSQWCFPFLFFSFFSLRLAKMVSLFLSDDRKIGRMFVFFELHSIPCD